MIELDRTGILQAFGGVHIEIRTCNRRAFGNACVARIDRKIAEFGFNGRRLIEMTAGDRDRVFGSEHAVAAVVDRSFEREAVGAAAERERSEIVERALHRVGDRHRSFDFVREAGEIRIVGSNDADVRAGRFNGEILDIDRSRVFKRAGRETRLSDRTGFFNLRQAGDVHRARTRHGTRGGNGRVVEVERAVVQYAFRNVDRKVFTVGDRSFGYLQLALIDSNVLKVRRRRRRVREQRVFAVDRHVVGARKRTRTLIDNGAGQSEAVAVAAEIERAVVRDRAFEAVEEGRRTGRVGKRADVGIRCGDRAGIGSGRLNRQIVDRNRARIDERVGRKSRLCN